MMGAMAKVLIIEDDEVLLALLQNLLKAEGYDTLATADGPRGISTYKENRPDLVLLDLGLPSMNGLEVLRMIRDFDNEARIIVITGYGSSETAAVAARLGAVAFVNKPFEPRKLLQRLRTLLGK